MREKVLVGNIRGPEGPEGPEGPLGPEGPPGPAGSLADPSSVENLTDVIESRLTDIPDLTLIFENNLI